MILSIEYRSNPDQKSVQYHHKRNEIPRAMLDISPESLPIRVEKPWGYEIWYAWTEQYVGKIIHVKKGGRLSLQYHELKDETSYLLSGKLLLVRGPSVDQLTEVVIEAGHQWRNTPGLIHTIEGIEDADVLEVSTPHLEDVIRLDDRYGRKGTNAP